MSQADFDQIASNIEWKPAAVALQAAETGEADAFGVSSYAEVDQLPFFGVGGGPSSAGDGLEVTGVVKGSGAAAAGIEVDDVILSVAGQPGHHVADVGRVDGTHQAGDEVAVGLRRGTSTETVSVRLSSR